MSGYVRELLRDCSLYDHENIGVGSELHIKYIDLYHALDKLYKQGLIDDRHVLALDFYYHGDMVGQLHKVSGVQELLSFVLAQIANEAGYEYSDESFVSLALTQHYPQYKRSEVAFVRNLQKYGDTFDELA